MKYKLVWGPSKFLFRLYSCTISTVQINFQVYSTPKFIIHACHVPFFTILTYNKSQSSFMSFGRKSAIMDKERVEKIQSVFKIHFSSSVTLVQTYFHLRFFGKTSLYFFWLTCIFIFVDDSIDVWRRDGVWIRNIKFFFKKFLLAFCNNSHN